MYIPVVELECKRQLRQLQAETESDSMKQLAKKCVFFSRKKHQ